MNLKEFIKKYLISDGFLKKSRPFYHGLMAELAAFFYGYPSKKVVVIGVTGTSGKSTTIQMLSNILNFAGKKCGYITTVGAFDGNNEKINKEGLSMPPGPQIQKKLSEFLKNGCKYAIVECTSEGLAQNRHLGTKFSLAILTNLYGAHLEAHGSFENYKKAKLKLFKKCGIIVVNLDEPNAEEVHKI